MAGGQMLDLAAQGRELDLPAITRLQQLKTGALIEELRRERELLVRYAEEAIRGAGVLGRRDGVVRGSRDAFKKKALE
jgi:geranylgeranyl pyrophosphate synthase